MNRIQHLHEALATDFSNFENSGPVGAVEAGKYSHSPESCHTVFAPLHYEQNYAYPLIVWLHGPQDDERQLRRIMPLVSMRNYVAVAPRGTLSVERGFGWQQTPDHIQQAEQRIDDAIAAAKARFNISSERIFLGGFNCGGTMAIRVAFNHPRRFAGVLSLAGCLPTGHAPLARLSELRRMRLFLASGRDSEQYPPDQVCQDLRLVHTAGMTVNLRQYPCGDELTTQMLTDMDRWIMEQLSGTASVASNAIGSGE